MIIEDCETEIQKKGGVLLHERLWKMSSGVYIYSDEWELYKKNGFRKYPHKEIDGSISMNKEEHDSWNRGYYGS